MRLNKLLASRLGVSRRKADELIKNGKVTVLGEVANVGKDITDADSVKFNNRPLPEAPENIVLMLNKPIGYVCSRKGQGSKTIFDLLPEAFHQLNPVGRLDKDSSGLMLLTNDGEFHNRLTHPSFQKSKSYIVVLDKLCNDVDLNKVNNGVQLNDGISKMDVKRRNNYLIVSMTEGRNRQIRRTFSALGYNVISLHRFEFGPYKLGSLGESKYVVVE